MSLSSEDGNSFDGTNRKRSARDYGLPMQVYEQQDRTYSRPSHISETMSNSHDNNSNSFSGSTLHSSDILPINTAFNDASDNTESSYSNFPHTGHLVTKGLNVSKRQTKSNNSSMKKDDDQSHKPKRALSAYNFFFQHERQSILMNTPTRAEGKPRRSHGKIGFADLARSIALKWKALKKEDRIQFDEKAKADKERYLGELEEWKKIQMLEVEHAANSISTFQHAMRPSHSVAYSDSARFPIIDSTSSNKAQFQSLPEQSFSINDAFANHLHLGHERISPRMNIRGAATNKTDSNTSMFQDRISKTGAAGMKPPPQVLETPPLQRQEESQISELATQLDDESTQLLLSMFR